MRSPWVKTHLQMLEHDFELAGIGFCLLDANFCGHVKAYEQTMRFGSAAEVSAEGATNQYGMVI